MNYKSFIVLLIFFLNNGIVYSQNYSTYKDGETTRLNLYKSGKLFQVTPVMDYEDYLIYNNTIGLLPKESSDKLYTWFLAFSVPGKVFKDVSFYQECINVINTGFIVTELGAVYKTTDNGHNWSAVMNIGFPYYWYGVHALSVDTIVISGFNNQGNIKEGVIRWSFNGGNTWTPDIILSIPGSGVGWLDKIHFFNQNTGIVFAAWSGGVHYTTSGGKDTNSWQYIQINPGGGWLSGNVCTQPSGNVYATGINFAKSTNFGSTWVSLPSIDNVFDGGVDFTDDNTKGWTGGGQISSPVQGWIHRTTNSGTNWSARYNFPYPIRAVKNSYILGNMNHLHAVGGNLYQEIGGIYYGFNGGANWTLEENTNAEMFSIKTYRIDEVGSNVIWCVGSTGSTGGYTGKAYCKSIPGPSGIGNGNVSLNNGYRLEQNYPNPFNPKTNIRFDIPQSSHVNLIIYDALGREVTTLVNEKLGAGSYEVIWLAPTGDGSSYPSGVYFYTIITNNFKETKRMVLLK